MMKRVISAALLAVMMLAACATPQIKTMPMFSRSESHVLSVSSEAVVCTIMLRNHDDKPLSFCLYGVYGGERVLALNESGATMTELLAPYETKSVVCRFPNKSGVPDDIVIVGQYE